MIQFAPTYSHRRNAAEGAILTFKNIFLAGLVSVKNNFPIYLWCWIAEKAEITINLIRTSRTKPILLAYEQNFGTFDFNATPMAPPGTKIIAH